MIEILSLSIALLAVIVSPLVTYFISKRNLEFEFRTMTQEKWIDKLEKVGFEFLNSNVMWTELYKLVLAENQKANIDLEKVKTEVASVISKINESIVKFQILLDEGHENQKQIFDSVGKMKSILLNEELNSDNLNFLNNYHNAIVKNLKIIITSERKKISKLFK